mmetsp:Transcript_30938/g.30419  ORF Transcript_30938/g.30419 Transcript_30938/m.30419 type:complete len:108 (-) Transcript_30938:151-474(-)
MRRNANNNNIVSVKDSFQSNSGIGLKGTLDISLYKERNDQFKIISNNIFARANMNGKHRYVHKTVKSVSRFFDPLRIRLRVMPLRRAPLVQGKNSDYYFVEAAKTSL